MHCGRPGEGEGGMALHFTQEIDSGDRTGHDSETLRCEIGRGAGAAVRE